MGFVNSCRLIFSPDFQNAEELSRGDLQGSCSALIDAVMKYLNFPSAAVVQRLRTLIASLLKITNFSKNFIITAEQRY